MGMDELMSWIPYKGYGSIADEIVLYLRDMHVVKAEAFTPYFVASIGAHIAHLGNTIRPVDIEYFDGREHELFCTKGGRPFDLRTHLLFVAPPGWGKSMHLTYFLDDLIGFLSDTKIPTRRYVKISEAGLIGSGKDSKGRVMHGDAELYKNGIFGIDEASSLFMHRSDYDIDLRNTLLQILDNGHVTKKLSNVEHDYMTYITLWMATQPLRLDLSHGLGRRVLVLRNSPTREDERELKSNQKLAQNQKPNFEVITNIREMVDDLWDGFNVKELIFSDELEDFKDKCDITHIDAEWVDRLAIGWNVMVHYESGDETLNVDMVHGLDELITNAINWKYGTIIDGIKGDLVKILEPKRYYSKTELKQEAVKRLNLTYDQAGDAIKEVINNKILETKREKTKGRPRTLYRLSPEKEILSRMAQKLNKKGEVEE